MTFKGFAGCDEGTGMTHRNTFHKTIRITLALALLAASFAGVVVSSTPAQATPVDCSRGTNLSFEQPVIDSDWDIVSTPGWSSTDTGIEIWQSGFNGAVAPDGDQLAELQGNNTAANWQDISTLPGDVLAWSFHHRGRVNDDTVRVDIGSTTTQTNEGQFTTGTTAFIKYAGTYTVPSGQTTTRFVLDPVDTGSVGNLVDLVEFAFTCDIDITTTFDGYTDLDTSGNVTVGDTFDFSYLVTNLGTATLDSVGVTDLLGESVVCNDTLLVPDASTTCSTTHSITQPEIDAGAVVSDATASGTDAAGVTVTSSDTESVPVEHDPAITLEKSGTSDNAVVAPADRTDVGDVIDYTFSVTNTGNVTLTAIAIDDPPLAAVTCPPDDVAPGATVECTGSYGVTQGDIEAGSVYNEASASATPPVGDAVVTTADTTVDLVQVTSIDITKSTATVSYDTVGEVVTYELTLTNTGNVALSDVVVSDANADDGSIECTPAAPLSLAPGSSATCTAEHTVTQDDLDSGSISNTASVDAVGTANDEPATAASNEVIVDAIQTPGLDVTKTVTSEPLGDGRFSLEYVITVTNTGNVTATSVAVTDDLDAVFGPDGYAIETMSSTVFTVNPAYDGSTDTEMLVGSDTLAPGASGAIYLSVTTEPTANPGPYVNNVSVLADGAGEPTSAVADVGAELDVSFDLRIEKTSSVSVAPGDDATWTITVINEGPSATFGPITVTDTLTDDLSYVGFNGTGWACTHSHGVVTCTRDGALASGESTSLEIVTTVNAAIGETVENRASVVASDGENETDPSNNAAVASINVDSLPITGIDTADFAAIALASLVFGLMLVGLTSRRRPRTAR